HAKAFFGNAGFVFEIFQGVLLADLRADAREDFGLVPREGEDIIGAKVKGAGAIGGAAGRQYKEAGIGMLGRGDGDSFIAGAGAGEDQKVRLKTLEFLQGVVVGVSERDGISGLSENAAKGFAVCAWSSNQQESRRGRSQVRVCPIPRMNFEPGKMQF